MSLKTCDNLKRRPRLTKMNTVLISFSKHRLTPCGEVVLSAKYKNNVEEVKFFDVEPEGESVLRGNICVKLGLLEKNGKIYTHRPKKSSQNWPKSRKKLEEVKLRRCRRRQLLKSLTFSEKPHHSPASSRKLRINIHCCLKLELLITLGMHKFFDCL